MSKLSSGHAAGEASKVVAQKRQKKVLTGVVVRATQSKTRLIEVPRVSTSRLYQKQHRGKKHLLVHDENNVSQVNDTVDVMECRPLSKQKHFRVFRVVAKVRAGEAEPMAEGSAL